jgi:2-keto-4-pentenoate hydratase/2-oxohepta-3-ene-1,7-dioic acid hydratase in catechol pathway
MIPGPALRIPRVPPLGPGDLVLTGFPAASVPIEPGDTVTCYVEGIGELTNPVSLRSVSGR